MFTNYLSTVDEGSVTNIRQFDHTVPFAKAKVDSRNKCGVPQDFTVR
jgi:hypothetical protein